MVAKLLCCSMMIFIGGALLGLWLQRQRRGK
jgi:hypothetical protein